MAKVHELKTCNPFKGTPSEAVKCVKHDEVLTIDLSINTSVCIHWHSENGRDYILASYNAKNWQGQWEEHYTDVYDCNRDYLGVWGQIEDE